MIRVTLVKHNVLNVSYIERSALYITVAINPVRIRFRYPL